MLDVGKAGDSTASSTVVAVQPRGSKPPLFCVHGGDGGVLFYHNLGARFDHGRPLYALPHWMAVVGSCLPLTHGIAAARLVAAGASLSSVGTLLWKEALVGSCYYAAAYVLINLTVDLLYAFIDPRIRYD